METKFTPGPWISAPVRASDDARIVYCLIGPSAALRGKRGVAYAGTYGKNTRLETKGIRQTDEECEANAHLIAAAPDMYKALDELLALYSVSDVPDGWAEEWQNCFAALKKARGES